MAETLLPPFQPNWNTYSNAQWVGMNMHAGQWVTSTAWPTAKLITYQPFTLPMPMTVIRMGWLNAATVNAGNLVQAGVYDTAYALLGSCAATAQGSLNVLQTVTPTTFTLYANTQYYMAFTCDLAAGAATSTFGAEGSLTIGETGAYGCLTEVPGTFGLPGTGTPIMPASPNDVAVFVSLSSSSLL